MYGTLIAIAGTGLILLAGELLWKKKILKGEYARKFVHILTASFAAFWPTFMSRNYIVLLSVLFMVVLVVAKKLQIFNSIRGVRRTSYGELLYALAIGLCAILFTVKGMYAIAVLHIALADGFAAIIGITMSHRASRFKFNGSTKSVEGSLTFLLISFFLNATYWVGGFSPHTFNSQLMFLIPLYSLLTAVFLTILEIISPKGSDNILVPVASGMALWLPFALFGSTVLFS